MDKAPKTYAEPPNVRMLRLLVTVLTIMFILGFAIVVALFVYKFRDLEIPGPMKIPDSIVLPPGTEVQAFTQGRDWHAVVTQDNRILIYGSESDQPIQEIEIGN